MQVVKELVIWYIGVWREALGYDERIVHGKQHTHLKEFIGLVVCMAVIIGFMWII